MESWPVGPLEGWLVTLLTVGLLEGCLVGPWQVVWWTPSYLVGPWGLKAGWLAPGRLAGRLLESWLSGAAGWWAKRRLFGGSLESWLVGFLQSGGFLKIWLVVSLSPGEPTAGWSLGSHLLGGLLKGFIVAPGLLAVGPLEGWLRLVRP